MEQIRDAMVAEFGQTKTDYEKKIQKLKRFVVALEQEVAMISPLAFVQVFFCSNDSYRDFDETILYECLFCFGFLLQ